MPSLAERLSALSAPKAIDFDPEDAFLDSEGSTSETEQPKDREHYVEVGKGRLRDDGLVVDEVKYKGSKVLRRNLFDHEEGSDNEMKSDEDDSESLEESEENDIESEEQIERGNSEFSNENEQDNENGENDSNKSSADRHLAPRSQQEIAAREEMRQLLKDEQEKAGLRARDAAKSDADKGTAVKSQINIYDSILDARIKLQQALTSSNVLPLSLEKSQQFSSENTPELTENALECGYTLLDRIVKLRKRLMKADNIPVGKLAHSKSEKKRRFSDAMNSLDTLDQGLAQFRTSVLTKWSRKIQSSSGSLALQSNKFLSLNQTAEVQVTASLADMDRLIKRTRINRGDLKILGEPETNSNPLETPSKADANLQLNENIYDDNDFYRQLLKDLVDRRMLDSSGVNNGVQWTASKPKNKKSVDTKASKGRKLRYHVQESIQNYAAPKPTFTWSDNQIDELFVGLFGQEVKLDDEEAGTDKVAIPSEVEVQNDGLRIFG